MECKNMESWILADKNSDKSKYAANILMCIMGKIKKRLIEFTFALDVFELVPVENNVEICSDGEHLYFNPENVINKKNIKGINSMVDEIVHIMFHGILGHFTAWKKYKLKKLCSAIMDRQVYKMMNLTGFNVFEYEDDYYNPINSIGFEEYYKAQNNKKFRKSIYMDADIFASDDHSYWMNIINENNEALENTWLEVQMAMLDEEGEMGEGYNKMNMEDSVFDVETFFYNKYSTEFGSSHISVKKAGGEEADYSSVLKEIVNTAEVVKEEDNIDYVLYQYGLSMYKDVPLIEPLECVETKRMNNLVIALDTSGSCGGEIIQVFLRETAAILKNIGAGMYFEGIYVIQCDCEIQKEQCFGDVYQLEKSWDEEEIYGFGGTSFIPVFDRIKELEDEGKEVDALLYLTDGWGDYPKDKVDYPTYFLLPRNEYGGNTLVPDWIKKVVVNV